MYAKYLKSMEDSGFITANKLKSLLKAGEYSVNIHVAW